MKAVGNGVVERLFLFNVAAFVPANLDNYELLGAVDTEIVSVEQEVLRAVLANNLREYLASSFQQPTRRRSGIFSCAFIVQIQVFAQVEVLTLFLGDRRKRLPRLQK